MVRGSRVIEVDDDYEPTSYTRPKIDEGGGSVPYYQGNSKNKARVDLDDESINFHFGGAGSFKVDFDDVNDITGNSFYKSAIYKKISENLSPKARKVFSIGVTVAGAAWAVKTFYDEWREKRPGSLGYIVGSLIETIVRTVRDSAKKIVHSVKNLFSSSAHKSSQSRSTAGGPRRIEIINGIPVDVSHRYQSSTPSAPSVPKGPSWSELGERFIKNLKYLVTMPFNPQAEKQAKGIKKIIDKNISAQPNSNTPSWTVGLY